MQKSQSSVFWKLKVCCHQKINVTAIIKRFSLSHVWYFNLIFIALYQFLEKTKYDSLIVPNSEINLQTSFHRERKIQIVDCMNPAYSSTNEALDIDLDRMTYFGVCEYLVWFYSVSQLILKVFFSVSWLDYPYYQ